MKRLKAWEVCGSQGHSAWAGSAVPAPSAAGQVSTAGASSRTELREEHSGARSLPCNQQLPKAVLCLSCCFASAGIQQQNPLRTRSCGTVPSRVSHNKRARAVCTEHFSPDSFSVVMHKPFHPRACKCSTVNQES